MTGESVWSDSANTSSAAEFDRTKLEEGLLRLFRSLSEGSLEALGMVYDMCSQQIYGLALWKTGNAADAADVLQEVFVRLASRRSMLHSVRRPLSYILQIAHHAAYDIFRNRRREVPQESNLILPVFDRSEDAPYVARLEKFIRELPSEQRAAVYLHYFAGLTLREVAKVTGVTLFTAASRCRLALVKLRKRLGEEKS